MMNLRASLPSPFSRKVRIVADILGLTPELTLIAADVADPKDPIRVVNPLGKIPALEIEDGSVIYDSAVIVRYLDERAGDDKVIPAETKARYAALTLEALADGVQDACILQVYEKRMRSENERSAAWVAYQAEKVARALGSLEATPPQGPVQVGQIALACALGYLDLRFEGEWRKTYPKLVAWLEDFSARTPAFAATAFKG